MTLAVGFFHLVFIFLAARAAANRHSDMSVVFWTALVLKLVAGVSVGWLYIDYYGSGDTLNYFADAMKLSRLAAEDWAAYLELIFKSQIPPQLHLQYETPRALFLTKVVSVLSIVTRDSYWIAGCYLSFISFLGAWVLVHTLMRLMPQFTLAAVASFLFLPSVVFWTSGLLKESLAMAALFFLSAMVLKLWCGERLRVWEYAVGLVMVVVLWNLKYYYVAAFLPVAAATLAYKYLVSEKLDSRPFAQGIVFLGMLVLPLAVVSILHPNFNVSRILGVIVANYNAYNALSEPGDMVSFEGLRATWTSVLRHSPWALFSGLFRPLFWEATNMVQFIAGVENCLLLAVFFASLTQIRRYPRSRHRLLILATFVFVVILAVFITLSAPNFGTLSRYRVGYLPFFVFVVLCGNPIFEYAQRRFFRLVSQ